MAESFGMGDMVWSCIELRNDGTIPGVAEDALLAAAGSRGVVVNVGSVEDHPEIGVFLVRFEDADGTLGPPVGCLNEELTQDQQLAAALASGVPPASDESATEPSL